jgi:excisionase family DNA binding protein
MSHLAFTGTPEKMLNPQEAGALLRLHAKTVIRMAERGEVPGKKIGKRWRFLPSLLGAWQQGELHLSGRP